MTRFGAGRIALVGFTTVIAASISVSMSVLAIDLPSTYATAPTPTDAALDSEIGANLEPHPDPNEEHYVNMVYVGRMHHEDDETRLGFDVDNGTSVSVSVAAQASLNNDTVYIFTLPPSLTLFLASYRNQVHFWNRL
jgi:hypothetical protein